jgi:hypothetical protein
MSFLKENKELAAATLKAGSSFFAGAFGGEDGPTQAQINAWNAQAAANTASANYQNQITANIQSGIPVSNKPPPGTGLINTVTGLPK